MTEKKEKKEVKKTVAKKSTSTSNKTTKIASSKVKKAVGKKAETKAVKVRQQDSIVVGKKSDVLVKVEKDKKSIKDKKVENKTDIIRATGRRKTSIAKVACGRKDSDISINVNDLDYKKYFTKLIHQQTVYSPFALLGIKTGYVVNAEVFGGGKTGQADALKLGLSKCLSLLSEEFNSVLKKNSFLTRDARQVEPKKYGLKKARKKEQFSKR